MMVYIGIIGCLFIFVLSLVRLKDIIAPPVIISAIWLLMYLVLFLRRKTVDLSSIYYLSFLVGLCFFVLGFFFIVRKKNKKNCLIVNERKEYYKFNPLFIKIILCIIFIISAMYFVQLGGFVLSNFNFNFWQTITIGKKQGLLEESLIVEYFRNFIITFATICGIVYFSNPDGKNKKKFMFSLVLALFFALTGGNRGIIFMLVLAVFFSYIIVKNYNNKKTTAILGVLTLILLSIFIIIAFLKFIYEDQSNTFEFIFKQMRLYFSTSTIAFVEWIENFNEYLYGKNTFRFFTAILSSLGYDIEVSTAVQEFVWIYGDSTNVFTIFRYYASDFGLIFSYIIQLFLGMFHGVLYKKSVLNNKTNAFYITLQSIFYFPLVYQFFDDRYFSLLSNWIQVVFWAWILTRKKILVKEKTVA